MIILCKLGHLGELSNSQLSLLHHIGERGVELKPFRTIIFLSPTVLTMKASHLCVAITFLWNTALASRLYAASYGGSVYSLDLKVHEGSPGISALSISKDCGSSPSWLMFDKENNILYCLNEAIGAPNGSITSFKSHSNGSLQTIQRLNTTAGPVMSNLYSAPGVIGHDFFAVAH